MSRAAKRLAWRPDSATATATSPTVTPRNSCTHVAGDKSGTSAGRGGTIVWPSGFAQAYPSPVVPQPGYDWPPAVTITFFCAEHAPVGSHVKTSSIGANIAPVDTVPLDAAHRLVEHKLRPAANQHSLQRAEHVERPIAHGEDLAAGFDFRRDAFGVEHGEQLIGPQRRQRRVQERPLVAKGGDDAAAVGRMRDVAARRRPTSGS